MKATNMGNYIVKKGLLLDEGDIGLRPDADLNETEKVLLDFLKSEFETEDGWPILELDGFASERLGSVHYFFTGATPPSAVMRRLSWVRPGASFRDIVLRELRVLPLPDPEAFLHLMETDEDAVLPALETRVGQLASEGNFDEVEALCAAMSEIRSTGLPGFQSDGFSRDGDDELLDYRGGDLGNGRRILVEIGFNWGQ